MTLTHTATANSACFNMIQQQIRPWLVSDDTVLSLLQRIPRANFVPDTLRALAYADFALPLTINGVATGEHMLEPKLEARLLQALNLHPHEKVLQVGTGSGYMAALMAHKAQTVVSLEQNTRIYAYAAAKLNEAGVLNVQLHCADGALGYTPEAPYDAILISAAVSVVPEALLQQLKVGGRLVAIVGKSPVMSVQQIIRQADNRFTTTSLFETLAPTLHNAPSNSSFSF
jgi:protein-L-isoaspartate(D-aspartate) O-methyltransferase